MGPYLHDGGRTAVCYSSLISVERAYCGTVGEALSLTGLHQGEGLEGLCWRRGEGGSAQSRIYCVCLEPGFGCKPKPML